MIISTETWSAPALADNVPVLRNRIIAFAEDAGVAEPPLENVRLAVSEALTNVVLHSYPEEQRPGVIEVRADRVAGRLVVRVCDQGVGMMPRHASPGLGLGLPLMAAVSDAMEVRARQPHGLELQLDFDVNT